MQIIPPTFTMKLFEEDTLFAVVWNNILRNLSSKYKKIITVNILDTN